ncbi:MAG: hypothetical protein H0W73_18070 [Bacteroidetes bacterium]|nr:hypothetical protein [Bacteroidota bacterium]
MSLKTNFYIRTDRPQADGSAQVYFVFSIDRKQRLKFATGKYIALKPQYIGMKPEDILKVDAGQRDDLYCWDINSQRATKGNKNLERVNFYLTIEFLGK